MYFIIIRKTKRDERKLYMNFFYILADSGNQGGSGLTLILMTVALLGAMYFFMIRPQRKQEKEVNAMRNNLQVGDEITTIGGIIGKVVSIKDETCMIESGRDRVRIRVLKSAIKSVDVPAAVANGLVAEPAKEEPKKTDEAAQNTDDKPEEKKKKGFFKKK